MLPTAPPDADAAGRKRDRQSVTVGELLAVMLSAIALTLGLGITLAIVIADPTLKGIGGALLFATITVGLPAFAAARSRMTRGSWDSTVRLAAAASIGVTFMLLMAGIVMMAGM